MTTTQTTPETASDNNSIAIVAMACRVPGASDVEQLWGNLSAGVDSIERWTSDEDERRELWHIYTLSIAFGAVDALSFPAFMSLTPRLVENRRLEAANAVVQGTAQVAAMIGPAIAGVVIAAVGVAWALGLDALSFAVSVVTLSMVVRILRTPRAAVPQAAPKAEQVESKGGAWRGSALRAV